jgi:hypothetical protein
MSRHGRGCDCDDCYDARRVASVRWCLNGNCCGRPAAADSDYCCEACELGDEPVMDCTCERVRSEVA